jgi:hypothetical protein
MILNTALGLPLHISSRIRTCKFNRLILFVPTEVQYYIWYITTIVASQWNDAYSEWINVFTSRRYGMYKFHGSIYVRSNDSLTTTVLCGYKYYDWWLYYIILKMNIKTLENRFRSACIRIVIIILYSFNTWALCSIFGEGRTLLLNCYRLKFAHRHINDPLIWTIAI